MRSLSIRRRIQLWFLSLTTLLLAGFSVTLYARAAADGVARLDQSLRDQAYLLAGCCEWEHGRLSFDGQREPAGAGGTGLACAVREWPTGRDLHRSPTFASAPLVGDLTPGRYASHDVTSATGAVTRHGVLLQELVDHDDDAVARSLMLVEVAADLEPLHAELRRFAWRLLLLWGVTMGCATLAASFLARRIVRPLARIAEETSRVEARAEGLVMAPGAGDEIDRLVDSLNRAFTRLRAAYDRQTRFTADASHELRTPLSVILTASEVALRRPRDADEYRSTLAQVVQAARRSEETLAGLLLLARADAGHLEARVEALSLAEVIADAVAGQDRVDVAVSGDCTLQGDRRLLRALIENLVGNALRYSPAGSAVHVRADTTAEGVRLEVEDEGIGIAADKLAHVFEPFYRTDEARTREAGGSGLGLAIVRAIADLHGATCAIRSRLREGTCVSVAFPRRAPLA